jgi:NitT/TauT family transport system substrate-binding protein
LVAVVAFVPGSAAGASPPRATAATPITIATLPLEPVALGFYAKDKGFFAKQGLDAKLVIVSDPSQLVASLLSGDAQFASLNVGGAAILKSRNAPLRMVTSGAMYRPKAPTTWLVAGPGKKISRARDLVGKLVAIDATNTIAHIGLLKWLKTKGVAAGDVRFVEIPFAQMLGPLRRGDVDAAVLPEPFLTLGLQRGGKRLAKIFDAVCAQDCLATLYLARRDMDTVTAARFRNAIHAAAVWANDARNDAASGAILAKYASLDKKLIAKMTRTRFAARFHPALAQPWIDVFAEFGVIPASFQAIDLTK